MRQQPEKLMKTLKSCKVLGPVATIFDSANTGSWRIERPVVKFEDCIKCGTCARYCPANIIDIFKDEKECVVIDYYYCKGCGICANECPKGCIEMVDERSARKNDLQNA